MHMSSVESLIFASLQRRELASAGPFEAHPVWALMVSYLR
jgi:hypothetical protein